MQSTHRFVLASGLTLTLMGSSPAIAQNKPVSQEVTEARQESQIWTTFALNRHLRANDLKVSVKNGKATLTGKVEESADKDLAKHIAMGVSGIKEVDNQIVVQADYAPAARAGGDRTFGETIEDATITAAVKSKLLWSSQTDGLQMDVDTSRGRVTLKGTADTAAAKEFAGRMARNTNGVVAVDNQLRVDASKPAGTGSSTATEVGKDAGNAAANAGNAVKSSAKEVGKEISDSWITAKVKSTFAYTDGVDASDISVTTVKGVVTLTGKADTPAEKAHAIELAKSIRGVKSVNASGLTIG